MPIYEYICMKCSEAFSLLKLSRAEEQTICPKCGSGDVRKKVSVFGSSGSSASGSYRGWGGG